MQNHEYDNKAPSWSANGVEPPDDLKTSGFQIGYKPPAEYFNWFWKTVSDCLNELQNRPAGIDVTGKVFTVDDVEVEAQIGAEIFNYINNIATGDFSHAEGNATKATGDYSHAEGRTTTASGVAAHAQGNLTTADGIGAFAGGNVASALGDYAFTFGNHTTAKSGNNVIGKFNKSTTETGSDVNTGDLFVIGNGLESGAKSNALRVTASGQVLGTTAYAATGADFAEMFEFVDGNPNSEDRRGLFVTLDGEKIRLATTNDDYVLGVVSATPSLLCNAHTDDWKGKYETDVFGARILENGAFKLAESFDKEKDDNYISRLDRPEWAAVGLIGQLIVVDDGTCQVNGYCYPSENGVATATETGYRVMARIDENHVKIVLK